MPTAFSSLWQLHWRWQQPVRWWSPTQSLRLCASRCSDAFEKSSWFHTFCIVLPIGMNIPTLTHLFAVSDRFIIASLEFILRRIQFFHIKDDQSLQSNRIEKNQIGWTAQPTKFGSKLPGEPPALLQFYMLGSRSCKLCTHLGVAGPCCSGSALPDGCDTSL